MPRLINKHGHPKPVGWILQVELHVDEYDPLEDCWVSNDPPPPLCYPEGKWLSIPKFWSRSGKPFGRPFVLHRPQTHKSSFIYKIIYFIFKPNPNPNPKPNPKPNPNPNLNPKPNPNPNPNSMFEIWHFF